MFHSKHNVLPGHPKTQMAQNYNGDPKTQMVIFWRKEEYFKHIMSMLDTLTQQEEEKPFIVKNRQRFNALGPSLVIVTPAMAYPMVHDNADVNIWLISHVWDLFFLEHKANYVLYQRWFKSAKSWF